MPVYKFVNPNMKTDTVDKNGKITVYKEIYVLAPSENAARLKAYRPKVDSADGMLSKEWELTKVTETNVDNK